MNIRIAYEIVRFKGHINIRAEHPTTLEITKEKDLTARGDCIVGVSADKGLKDFRKDFKSIASKNDSIIYLLIITKVGTDCVVGWGDEGLSFEDPLRIIVRKSTYVSPNTVMVRANKSAADLRRELINYLRRGGEGLAIFTAALLNQ